ncbi:hypothetical protein KW801_01615 [Candidatus Saccharibacteria bacterium]|nr:hypothetical protein [Candidatus Saccharibacteria bacterium]
MAKKQSYLKKKQTFSGAQILLFTLVFATVGAVAIWQSLAAPHNGGGTFYTGTVSSPIILNDANSDGLVNFNDQITFKVTSNAPYPFVRVMCYQGSTKVYEKSQGFYSGWLWGTDYGLNSPGWPGGAADCTATLYSQTSNKKGVITQTTMATLNFHVSA